MSRDSAEIWSSSLGEFECGECSGWGEEEARTKGFEDRSFGRLVDLVDGLAPHLIQSFICTRSWWEKHEGLPEAHVRFVLIT
jgi:hypothetical protein